jgi:hypothetical protein
VKFAYQIDADDKETYLEYLRQGMRPNQAARECDSTGTQFRRFRSSKSQYYDHEFAEACEEILSSAQHRRELEERVRDMVWDAADEGNWNARWKLALTYLPEFEWAKSANLNVNMQMQVLTKALPALSMEELERVQAALANGEKPALEAVPEVIDAA